MSVPGWENFLPVCAENPSDPWLEWVQAAAPVNESVSSTTLMGLVCVPAGFVFAVGVTVPLGPLNVWTAGSQLNNAF